MSGAPALPSPHETGALTRNGLSIEKMLELELTYAHQTAGEANTDRTSLVTMYLTIFSAALYAYDQFNKAESLHASFLMRLIFLGVWGIGFSFLFKLIRLRQALWGSIKTMNRIKEVYRENFPEFSDAFAWNTKTLPAAGKPWSLTYNMAFLIVILDSVALAAAVYTQALSNPDSAATIWPFYWSGLAFISSCAVQERFYAYHVRLKPAAHATHYDKCANEPAPPPSTFFHTCQMCVSVDHQSFSFFHKAHQTLGDFIHFFCFGRDAVRGGLAQTAAVNPVAAAGSAAKLPPRAQSAKKRK